MRLLKSYYSKKYDWLLAEEKHSEVTMTYLGPLSNVRHASLQEAPNVPSILVESSIADAAKSRSIVSKVEFLGQPL